MTEIPIHSYEDLRKKANDFLHAYNPSGTIPVPIEEIVEFEFGINIVPILGLQREFEIEGFTSSDLKNIYVDEYVNKGHHETTRLVYRLEGFKKRGIFIEWIL